MKILLIEDNVASIANAKQQFAGHELKIATTAMETIKLLKSLQPCDSSMPTWQPDVIVTDVNIPMGDADIYGVSKHYQQTDSTPAGLVVAMRSLVLGIPCYVITDSNSHRDLIGLMMDKILDTFFSYDQVTPENDSRMSKMFDRQTRPDMLENGGKDYTQVLGWIAKFHSGTSTR